MRNKAVKMLHQIRMDSRVYNSAKLTTDLKNLAQEFDKEIEQSNRYREALKRIAYDDELLSNTDDIVVAIKALKINEVLE